MTDKEKKISNYIDSLNEEKRPSEHGFDIEDAEMQGLLETARLVKSLKEPNYPDDNYSKNLASNISKELFMGGNPKELKKKWFLGVASVAAAAVLIVTLNTVGPLGKTDMVYAMEKAYKKVKAYHGILEVIESNNAGDSSTQSKIEVWADKEGRYYVKGIEGIQKNLVTVNDGEKKWQVQPEEREVELFTAFPDPYSFTFEIGKEIEDLKSALQTRVVGNESVAGRDTVVMEVTPKGGSTYKLWIDKETNMPLKKQSAMENSIQYTVRYTDIDFQEAVPKELLDYKVPNGFVEKNTNLQQIVRSMEEAKGIVGFTPKTLRNTVASFAQYNISVVNDKNIVNMNYVSGNKKVVVIQKKASEEFKSASMAVLGKINNNVAEIQSQGLSELGVLLGLGTYEGVSGITSVRWQEEGMEFAVVGNTSVNELTLFVKSLTTGSVELALKDESMNVPEVKVPVDLKVEEGDQKNVDAGHSPWKLDPAFVAQVFVSLQLSPEGIVGDYPINYEEFKVVKNTGSKAVVEVGGDKTPISKVYLEKLIRKDSTGIWTVVGYDAKK